jgi:predicted GIY-YIG superfamily endonuclease
MKAPALRAPYVYRVYDRHGLIYVGSTIRLWTRLAEHRRYSWWSRSAVRVRAELCPSLEVARRREQQAQIAERPRWNVHEQAQLIHTWNDDEFEEYLERWITNAVNGNEWHIAMYGKPRLDVRYQARRLLRRYQLHHGHPYDTARTPRLLELA